MVNDLECTSMELLSNNKHILHSKVSELITVILLVCTLLSTPSVCVMACE